MGKNPPTISAFNPEFTLFLGEDYHFRDRFALEVLKVIIRMRGWELLTRRLVRALVCDISSYLADLDPLPSLRSHVMFFGEARTPRDSSEA